MGGGPGSVLKFPIDRCVSALWVRVNQKMSTISSETTGFPLQHKNYKIKNSEPVSYTLFGTFSFNLTSLSFSLSGREWMMISE